MAGLLALVALMLAACGAAGGELSPGDEAPAFTLPAATGEDVSLGDYTGEQPVLLYFHMAGG